MSDFSEPVGIGDIPNRYWTSATGAMAGLEAIGTDANGGRAIVASGYGTQNGGSAVIHSHRARGTELAPLPVYGGDDLCSIGMRAWNGTGFTGSSAAIQVFAAEGSSGKQFIGTDMSFEVTPLGGTPYRANKMWLLHTGQVTLPANFYGAGVLQTDASGNVTATNLEARIAALEARLAAASIP